MLDRAGDGEGGGLGLHERGGVEGFLVAGVRVRLVPAPAAVAGQTQHVVSQA